MCIFTLIDNLDVDGLDAALNRSEEEVRNLLQSTNENRETPIRAAARRWLHAHQHEPETAAACALQNLLQLIAITRQYNGNQLAPQDTATLNEAAEEIIDDIITNNGDLELLRQILRLPLPEALLSSFVITAFDNDNLEAATILLGHGANPTITHEGEIFAAQNLFPQDLVSLAIYDFMELTPEPDAKVIRLALKTSLLLCYGCQTAFPMSDGSIISIVDLTAIGQQLALTREFAALGVNPCYLFETYLAAPTDMLLPYVLEALEGIDQCWEEATRCGFLGQWLFVSAFQSTRGNHLISCLDLLGNLQVGDDKTQIMIRELRENLEAVDVNAFIPLQEQVILKQGLNPDIDWQNAPAPWNSEEDRRLAHYCERIYRQRHQLTEVQFMPALIRLRALQSMLALGLPLTTANQILQDLER